MIRLSAFADEIAPGLRDQIDVLCEEGITHLELRSVWSTNVLDLTDAQLDKIASALAAAGVGVVAIGSPVGKVPIDDDWAEHVQRFERALVVARRLEAPAIRLFSFYPPRGTQSPIDWMPHRTTILTRFGEMAERAEQAGVTLLHENDTGLYGDSIERCRDLLSSVDNPFLRAAFDPANFILSGQAPYPDAYEVLRPWVGHVHVKDADAAGHVVAAGEGIGNWPELLRRLAQDGYNGYFSLEPHLASAGRFQGFSGPGLFRHASQTFQALARTAFVAGQ